MPTHSLHTLIARLAAQIIEDLRIRDSELLLDGQCGGSRRLSLFRGRQRSSAERICQADIAIKHNGSITIIIEIEEEGSFHPGRRFGKATATDSANYLIASDRAAVPVPLRDISFIQIVNTGELSPRSKKLEQYQSLEPCIASYIRSGSGYFLLAGTGTDFKSGEAGSRLRKFWQPGCVPQSSSESLPVEALRTVGKSRQRILVAPATLPYISIRTTAPRRDGATHRRFVHTRHPFAPPIRGLGWPTLPQGREEEGH